MEFVLIALMILLAFVLCFIFTMKKTVDGIAYIISALINAFRRN